MSPPGSNWFLHRGYVNEAPRVASLSSTEARALAKPFGRPYVAAMSFDFSVSEQMSGELAGVTTLGLDLGVHGRLARRNELRLRPSLDAGFSVVDVFRNFFFCF